MRKKNKIYALLAVLVVVCILTVIVSNQEEKKESIQTSGEVVLEIPTDEVTSVSWTDSNQTLSFTKNDDMWTYDDDITFPVNATKIEKLLSIFESFSSTFVIDDVTDYSQYGLDDPTCTITINTSDTTYTIKLGDYSTMDSERYVDIGDGKVYLAASDPYENYNVQLSTLVQNDDIPVIKTVSNITFSGTENYTITKDTDKTSICEDDKYYTGDNALDTDLVDTYVNTVKNLALSEYATYNASDEEIQEYGMDNPDLTITMTYQTKDSTDDEELVLHVSSNAEEKEAYDEAVENGDDTKPSVTRYVRVGDSQIVYVISETKYNDLTAVSYDTLRHQKIFTGDTDLITSMNITLDGTDYTFTKDGDTWKYNDEEIDTDTLISDIKSLSASSFTTDTTSNQKEVSITLNLNNENYPTVKIDLYRYDGTSCVAYVDEAPLAYVKRSDAVNIIEAINKIVLN